MTPPSRRVLAQEVWIVLGLSLGASALYAVLNLTRDLTSGRSLHAQQTVLNATVTSHSLLDLAYQLIGLVVGVVPFLLVAHLLRRGGEDLAGIGLTPDGPVREAGWAAALALLVGAAGLGIYLGAYHLGFNVKVVPTNLPPAWWRIPVLVLSALRAGLVEETVVCGYLLHRLGQLRWRPVTALAASALLRGAYHLYQGFGGFAANVALGLFFGRLYQRNNRLTRLVGAHALIDMGAFVGYLLLRPRVSWLP